MPVRVLKVLMLHGHEQSAEIFEPITSYIQRAFHTFASDRDITFQFRYLSGILPAYPDRIEDNGQRVWGYGAPNDGEIKKTELSIQHILDTLDREGPFAGIVGFSSGAAMAAIIASLLEKKEMVCNIPWKIHRPKLSFAICLSGFRLGSAYQSIYQPAISTPILLTIGTDDPVIVPAQTRSLANQCQYAKVFEFSGIHYVPQRKEFPTFCKFLGEFLEGVLDPPQIDQPASLVGVDYVPFQKVTTPGARVKMYQKPTLCHRRRDALMISRRWKQ